MMKKYMRAVRLLCMVLAIVCACAALVTHSHECLRVRCVGCAVRRAMACAWLVLGGKLALDLVILGGWTISARAPANPRETLVQMKVKLSN